MLTHPAFYLPSGSDPSAYTRQSIRSFFTLIPLCLLWLSSTLPLTAFDTDTFLVLSHLVPSPADFSHLVLVLSTVRRPISVFIMFHPSAASCKSAIKEMR